MTQSGIDKDLRFRHLVVIRTADIPGGVKTKQLVDRFREAGGRFHSPHEDELRTLAAVRRLIEENTPRLEDWLRQRKPVTNAGLGSRWRATGCCNSSPGVSPSGPGIPRGSCEVR